MGDSQRLPPSNQEAEERVLGAILLDPAVLPEVRRILLPEDFYRRGHGLIFAAMRSVADDDGRPVDILTVVDELKRTGKLDAAGGSEAVARLADDVGTARRVGAHARLVAGCAAKRRLIHSLTAGLERAWEDEVDADVLAADLRALLDEHFDLTGRGGDATETATEIMATLGPEPEPIVDSLIAPGTVGLISADAGAGKTTTADALAIALAAGRIVWGRFAVPGPRPVLWIQMEDPRLRHAKRWARLSLGMGLPEVPGNIHRWKRPDFYLDDPRDLADMMAVVREKDIGLVLADPFIYLNQLDNENDPVLMRNLLRPLKRMFYGTRSSFFFLDHNPHADPKAKARGDIGRPRGSTVKMAWRDTHLFLSPRGPQVYVLAVVKDYGKQEFLLCRNTWETEDGQKAERIEYKEMDAPEVKVNESRDAVLEAIRTLVPDGQRANIAAIVKQSGKSKNTVIARLKELAQQGQVEHHIGSGRHDPAWAKLIGEAADPQGGLYDEAEEDGAF